VSYERDNVLRKQGYMSGRDDARRIALEAIDEAMRVVAANTTPERAVRLSAMQHVRTIVAARLRRPGT
jgi:hypothetical protein